MVDCESLGNIESILLIRILLNLKWRRSLDVQELRVYVK